MPKKERLGRPKVTVDPLDVNRLQELYKAGAHAEGH